MQGYGKDKAKQKMINSPLHKRGDAFTFLERRYIMLVR